MKRPGPNKTAARGFTLVEVLIALTLLALLMALLTGAARSLGQTDDRVEQRVQAAEDYRLAMDFLGGVLGRVSARQFRSLQAGTSPQMPFFQAQSDSLAWIGVLPARYGAGGRQYMRLAVEAGAGGARQLVLRFAPWNGAPVFTDWGQAQAQTLADSVQSLSLSYLDPASGQWSEVWPPPGMTVRDLPPTLLPAAVQVRFDGPAPAWPPLVVAVTPTFISDPSVSRGDFGGGRAR